MTIPAIQSVQSIPSVSAQNMEGYPLFESGQTTMNSRHSDQHKTDHFIFNCHIYSL